MKSKILADHADEKTYILVLDEGDEAFTSIQAFAEDNGIAGASITAIGAFRSAVVGFFPTNKSRIAE